MIFQDTCHEKPFWDWEALFQFYQMDRPELFLPRETFSFQQWNRVFDFTQMIFTNWNTSYHLFILHTSLQWNCRTYEQDANI